MGIFKSKFYIVKDVPLIEKIVGAAVILFLLYVSITVLYRHTHDFFRGLKEGSPISFGTLLTITLLVVSKSIDGLARKLEGLGIAVSEEISMQAEALEEIFKLGIPTVIFITLNAYLRRPGPD